MGLCGSKNKKINNLYILKIQMMLSDLDMVTYTMLDGVKELNDIIYGYDQHFSYELHKSIFVSITKKMEKTILDFEERNSEILKTLTRQPHQFWIYHNNFCRKKCDKMYQFEVRYDYYYENPLDKNFYTLCDEIEDFNKSMSLPAVSTKEIRPLLSDVLKYSKV